MMFWVGLIEGALIVAFCVAGFFLGAFLGEIAAREHNKK